jgi:4,5-DOPA dioxygenase extradiol
MARGPVAFVSHGAPSIALEDDGYTRALAAFGASLAPTAIVVVSAHWEASRPVRVNADARPELVYDFGGFAPELYRLTYPAAGAPELAREIGGRLEAAGMEHSLTTGRGWDHGLWVPLRLAFPAASSPVVEVALPRPRTPAELLAMGRALAPLRDRGILLLGSGGAVHNLSRIHFEGKDALVDEWARGFDDWLKGALEERRDNELLAYRERAPHADLAVPTDEHFDPLFFALGAAEGESVRWIYEGFQYGNLSMRSLVLGA